MNQQVAVAIHGARGEQGAGRCAPVEEVPADAGFAEEALPYLDSVYRFALRLTRGDEAEAEDLVQDTYLRAYRGWSTYTRGTQCRSWLFTICRNVAVRRGEVKSARMEHLATDLGVDDVEALASVGVLDRAQSQDPEGDFFDSLVDDEVRRAIDGLPREYRDAVVLCDLEGFGYGEIAEMLGVAGGTIKSRIHRGRRLLQQVLHSYAVEVGYLRPSRVGN
ncbi:MAG TPA: sigma-70 family RNA polymerase sigma factor [Longimicrobiaceae bacterium]|nr:sigma-70 family RNA polymerase sigma factor [Longimicrobiaceae bacterium]